MRRGTRLRAASGRGPVRRASHTSPLPRVPCPPSVFSRWEDQGKTGTFGSEEYEKPRKAGPLNEPSNEVRIFIDAFIESIDLLRILIALAREPNRTWTEHEMAGAVGFSLETTQQQLERLQRNGFAAAEMGPPRRYRYAPRAEEFDRMIRELVELDDHRPVTLIRLVYARTANSAAQAFADSFRFRKP